MRRFVFAMLSGCLVLGAAACGGDDDDTEAVEDAVDEATDDDGTDDDGTDDATTDPGDDVSDADDESDEAGANPDSEYCRNARAYEEEFGDAGEPTEEALAALEAMKEGAPDDVADALDTFVRFGERLLAGDEPTDDELLEEFPTLFEDSLTFAQYLEDECGIDIMETDEEVVDPETLEPIEE